MHPECEVSAGRAGQKANQAAGDGAPRLTTQQGIVVSDDQNTLRAGPERDPAALEDFHFREKIFHFDHERIPERQQQVSGSAARVAAVARVAFRP